MEKESVWSSRNLQRQEDVAEASRALLNSLRRVSRKGWLRLSRYPSFFPLKTALVTTFCCS